MDVEFTEFALLGAAVIGFGAAYLFRRRNARKRMGRLSDLSANSPCLLCDFDDDGGPGSSEDCPQCGFDRAGAAESDESADLVEFLERLSTHRDSLVTARRLVADPFAIISGLIFNRRSFLFSTRGRNDGEIDDAARMQLDAVIEIKELVEEFPGIAKIEVPEVNGSVGDIVFGALAMPGKVGSAQSKPWSLQSEITERGILGQLATGSELKSDLRHVDAIREAVRDRLRAATTTPTTSQSPSEDRPESPG